MPMDFQRRERTSRARPQDLSVTYSLPPSAEELRELFLQALEVYGATSLKPGDLIQQIASLFACLIPAWGEPILIGEGVGPTGFPLRRVLRDRWWRGKPVLGLLILDDFTTYEKREPFISFGTFELGVKDVKRVYSGSRLYLLPGGELLLVSRYSEVSLKKIGQSRGWLPNWLWKAQVHRPFSHEEVAARWGIGGFLQGIRRLLERKQKEGEEIRQFKEALERLLRPT